MIKPLSKSYRHLLAVAMILIFCCPGLMATEQLPSPTKVIPIEDYDSLEYGAMRHLYQKLLRGDSLVRIAVLGDSFIEVDILTCDLREALQSRFGGRGVGYTPAATPLTAYRPTIKTRHSGWKSYGVMQFSKAPEQYKKFFPISGWLCIPTHDGATISWTTSSVRQHIDTCQRFRFQFLARRPATIELSLNGGSPQRFEVEASDSLQQIELDHEAIVSAKFRLVSGHSGFVAYGALFEGDGSGGVMVDNYSVRGNNGRAIFSTSPSINRAMNDAVGGYDLVVLQYGLNILQHGVNRYTAYQSQVRRMVNFAKESFPGAAVLVMGVSDRSYKSDDDYSSMVEAQSLSTYQRAAAKECGVAFWDTRQAMILYGGMNDFVANGWAAKDYTHINFKGGRQVAASLYSALSESLEQEDMRMVRIEHHPPIITPINSIVDVVRVEQHPELFTLSIPPQQWTQSTPLELEQSRVKALWLRFKLWVVSYEL